MSYMTRYFRLLGRVLGALALIKVFLSGSSVCGQDRAIRIDFGLTGQQSAGVGWNNLHGIIQDDPTTVLNLVDTTGAATGFQMTPTWQTAGDDTGVAGIAAN